MSTVPHTSSTDKPELEQNHAVVRIDPDRHAVPAAIAHLPRFAVWRYDEVQNKDGTTKWTKVPYRPNGVGTASKINAADWGTLEESLATVRRDPSTGLAFCLNSTALVGVDFDRVLDANGNPSAEFQGLLKHLHGVGCYAEFSPSGTGVKILLRADAGAVAKAVAALTGKTNKETTKFTAARPGLKEVQVFYGGGYFTLTGVPWGREEWNGQRWDDATQALEALVRAAHALKFREGGKANKTHEAPIRLAVALSDDEVLDKAFAAKNGSQVRAIYDGSDEFHGGDASAADCALAGHLAFYCGPNGHDQVARIMRASPRTRDKFDRDDYMAATMVKAYEGRTEFYDPARKRTEPRSTTATKGTAKADALVDEFALGAAFQQRFHGTALWTTADRWYRMDEVSGIFQHDKCETMFGEAMRLVQDVLDGPLVDARESRRMRRVAVAHATIRAGRAFGVKDGGLAIYHGDLDTDPWLLGTPAGVIDLKTGKLRKGTVADLVTKSTRVAPADKADESTCPHWLAFLHSATERDEETMQFLQRHAGYLLTGDASEHCFLMATGPGGTGKSTYLETLAYVLGDYATTMSAEVLMDEGNSHPTHVASLAGARLATASEFPEGKPLNEARLKRLTGNDSIRARFVNQDEFEFPMQAKIVAATNHRPRLRETGSAMARRLCVVEFTHKPAVPDHTLRQKLEGEAAGILRWMLEGLQALLNNREKHNGHGLLAPDKVVGATAAYLADEDSMSEWWDECFMFMPEAHKREQGFVATVDLLASWNDWADKNGVTMRVDTKKLAEFMHLKLGIGNPKKETGGQHRRRGFYGIQRAPRGMDADGCSD